MPDSLNDKKEEKRMLKKMKRQCWCPDCKGLAIFEDWCGWHWCLSHTVRNIRYDEHRWFYFKMLKIRNPF